MKKAIIIGMIGLAGMFAGQAQQYLLVDGDTLSAYAEKDSLTMRRVVTELLIDWIDEGYIYASLDKVQQDSSRFYWSLSRGTRIKWDQVVLLNYQDDSSLTVYKNHSPKKLIYELASQGYPFAGLSLIEKGEQSHKIQIRFEVDKGPLIRFDSLTSTGENPLKISSLYNVLGFEPGDLYDESIYRELPDKLSELSFIEMDGPADIGFSGGNAIVYLQLKQKRANRFDGMLGIVPGGTQSTKTRIIGDLNLGLVNLFRSATAFNMQWKSFSEASQSLDMNTSVPFVGKTGISLGGQFSLLKQDTSFVNRFYSGKVGIRLLGSTKLSVVYEGQSNSLQGESDPQYQSFNYRWYGLDLSNRAAHHDLSRTNRLSYGLNLRIGDRRLDAGDTSGLQTRTQSWVIRGDQIWQRTIGQRGLFYWRNSATYLFNKDGVIANEQFRLGGVNSIRGFVENQFFAQKYYYSNVEYRLYFERQSFIRAFIDVGGFSDISTSSNTLSSFGMGLALDTDAGIFSFIFANGQQHIGAGNTLFNNLIHFGFTSTF